MSEPKDNNVPRFASFRPKIPAAPVQDDSQVKDTRSRNDSETKHRSRREGKDNKKESSHHHRRDRSRSREARSEALVKVPSPEPEKQTETNIFVIDRKGDLNNLVYGSVHKYSVPPFRRYGAGRVLGASSDVRIDRSFLSEKAIVLANFKSFGNRNREKYVFAKVEKERPRLLKMRPEALAEENDIRETDFVPLQPRGKKRKRTSIVAGENSGSEHDERDYRSIHETSNRKEAPGDDDLQYATESESSGSKNEWAMETDSSVKQKNIGLSRMVEQHPHDIEAWIALINHQDEMIRGGDERRRLTNAEVRSTAEIKLHMFEKAIGNAESPKDRERLLVGLMSEGAKIWDVKAQAHRWEQISKDNIDNHSLWKKYLDFKQSTFSIFRYEEVRDVYVRRIEHLSRCMAASDTATTLECICHQLIYVVLRLTLFIRESGFSELAVATWQAVLEMNFQGPEQPIDNAKDMFKDFWESEAARIGEVGAMGWRHFIQTGPPSDIADPIVDEPNDTLANNDIFKDWATAERLRSRSSRLPAKTMDEVVEDDPFRVILFSDIEEFLMVLPPSESLRKSWINAFLSFCRLPPLATIQDNSFEWLNDSQVRGEFLEVDTSWLLNQFLVSPSEDEKAASNAEPLLAPMQNFLRSPYNLFADIPRTTPYHSIYAADQGPLNYQWIRNCLKQLNQASFDESLAEFYLSFEFLNERETIKKVAKGLIKQKPTNLRLYNAYGLIEWFRGNKDVAAAVFTAALNMSHSMPETDQANAILVWRSWIWACLEDGNNQTALSLLLSVADGIPSPSRDTSPALVLKAKQHFSSNRDFLITSNNAGRSAMYSECSALLEYLSSGNQEANTPSGAQGNIESAIAAFTSFSNLLHERQHLRVQELYLQSASRLLHHYAITGPYRPAFLREHLERFIRLFPRNTIFLELHSWNERRLRMDNRVRKILLGTALSPEQDTLTSRLFSIHHEIHNGTIHSAKSAFEHAVSSPMAKTSAALWRLYILFCLRTPRFQSQAKEVWLRSLRACPWAKELYLFGFENLCDMVGFGEMKSIWRVMGEKELRIHVDLEDRFDEVSEQETNGPAHRRVARQ